MPVLQKYPVSFRICCLKVMWQLQIHMCQAMDSKVFYNYSIMTSSFQCIRAK